MTTTASRRTFCASEAAPPRRSGRAPLPELTVGRAFAQSLPVRGVPKDYQEDYFYREEWLGEPGHDTEVRVKLTSGLSLRASRIPLMVAFAFIATLPCAVLAQVNPLLIGTWKLNFEKSTFDPGPAPSSETVIYEKAGDGVKRTVETVRADGSRDTRAYTAKYDGKDYSDIGPNFDTIALTRIDVWTVDETVKKAGRVVYMARQVVSKDGRIITTTVTGTDAIGQIMHNVRVLDKQQPPTR